METEGTVTKISQEHKIIDVVDEYIDRERCKNNLIVHNLTEALSNEQ